MSPQLTRDLRKRVTVVYEQVISLWPQSVEIPVGSQLTTSGNTYFPHLVTICCQIEAQILNNQTGNE